MTVRESLQRRAGPEADTIGCARSCSRASRTWPRRRRRRVDPPGSRSRSYPSRSPWSSPGGLLFCAVVSACWPGRCPSTGSLATYAARRLHPGHRLPGHLGLRAGRVPDPARWSCSSSASPPPPPSTPVPAVTRRRPVVTVGGSPGGGGLTSLSTHPHLHQARHGPRPLRDRRVPGARVFSWSTRPPRHPERVRRQCTPPGFHGIAGVIGGYRCTRSWPSAASRGARRWPKRPGTRGGRSSGGAAGHR